MYIKNKLLKKKNSVKWNEQNNYLQLLSFVTWIYKFIIYYYLLLFIILLLLKY